MDNEEFLERLRKITRSLAPLGSELYKASKPNTSAALRSEVINRAKAHLKEYEDFLPILTPGRRDQAIRRCRGDIENIREKLAVLEEME
jgi:hypothetical protein